MSGLAAAAFAKAKRALTLAQTVEGSRPIVLTDFAGVDRTGVADSRTALQSFLTAAAGVSALIPHGTYRLNGAGLSIPAAGIDMYLDDAILDFRDLTASANAITSLGTLGTPVAATATAKGALAITGTGVGTGLVFGDEIKLWSDDIFDPGQTNTNEGERCRVLSATANQINLIGAVEGVYSTGVKVAKVTPCPVTLRGSGLLLLGGVGSQHRGVSHQLGPFKIRGDIEVQGGERAGVQVYDSDYDITGLKASDCTDSSTGYGFAPTSTSSGTIRASRFSRCRHWVSCVNSTSNFGGVGGDHVIDDCEGRTTVSTGDGFDAHAANRRVTVRGSRGYDAANCTVNLECLNCRVEDNQSYRATKIGFLWHNTVATRAGRGEINRNLSVDSVTFGTRYTVASGLGVPTPEVLDMLDNVSVRCGSGASWMDPTGEHRLRGARMLRNLGIACSQTAGSSIFRMAAGDDCEMDNRSLNTPTTRFGSHAIDYVGGRFGGHTHFVTAGSSTARGFMGEAVIDAEIRASTKNATGAGCTGLELDSASLRCTVLHPAGLREANIPMNLNGVMGHVADYSNGRVEVYATDANKTWTAFSSAGTIIWTQPLAASRAMSASTTKAQPGMRFRVVRALTATGPGNITVPGGLLTAPGQWADIVFDGTAWGVSARGWLAGSVAGKDLPNPSAAQDGKGFYYDSATGAFIWGTSPATQALLDAKLNASEKATASGVASLDGSSRVVQAPKLHASAHGIGGADRVYPADLGEFFDRRRSAEVSTMPRLLVTASAGTFTSGTVYGALAWARTAVTRTKIRFITGTTAPAGCTDARGIVWNSDNTLRTDTGNQSATVTLASTLYELTLAAPVVLAEGDEVRIGVGFVATTMPTIRGVVSNSSVMSVTPKLLYSGSGWTADTSPPALNPSAGPSAYPWVELIP